MLQNSFGTANFTTINSHHFWYILGRLDKTSKMSSHSGQTEHLSEFFIGEFYRGLVGKLAHNGAS
jgi:hypothetical protein